LDAPASVSSNSSLVIFPDMRRLRIAAVTLREFRSIIFVLGARDRDSSSPSHDDISISSEIGPAQEIVAKLSQRLSDASVCSLVGAALFVVAGFYFLTWTIQSASFSVPADPQLSEHYKTRALLLLPLSILYFAIGAIFFLILKPRRNGWLLGRRWEMLRDAQAKLASFTQHRRGDFLADHDCRDGCCAGHRRHDRGVANA
jgi:hypothetical protein